MDIIIELSNLVCGPDLRLIQPGNAKDGVYCSTFTLRLSRIIFRKFVIL
jgi:hypothetical protein